MREKTFRRVPKKPIGSRLLLLSLGVLLSAAPVSAIDVRDHRDEKPFVGPTGYTFCAREGEHCRFQGTANVAYGAGVYSPTLPLAWVFKLGVSGGIDCQDDRFPPLSASYHLDTKGKRACYIKDVLDHRGTGPGGDRGGPAGFAKCAENGQRCAFRGTADVAWGVNGAYFYKEAVTNGIDCIRDAFPGKNPLGAIGTIACYMRLLPEKVLPPGPTNTPSWRTPTPTPVVRDHR